MEIYSREHFNNDTEASVYYISIMDKLIRDLNDAVMCEDSQLIIQIGNLFIEASNRLKETQIASINAQQESIKEIMRLNLN